MRFFRTPRVFGWSFALSVSPPSDVYELFRISGVVNNRAWIEELGYISESRAVVLWGQRGSELASVFDPDMVLGLQYYDQRDNRWYLAKPEEKVQITSVAVFKVK